MNAAQELQHSRIMAVKRQIARAMDMAFELGKMNARMGYTIEQNAFRDYPLEALRLAWLSGWKDFAENDEEEQGS